MNQRRFLYEFLLDFQLIVFGGVAESVLSLN